MKTLKTILLLILSLALLTVLPACTSILSDETSGAANNGTAADETAPKILVMATDATFPPYEYTENNAFTGIDVEIAQKIAEKLGLELQIKNMAFTDIIAAVQSKQADIGMAALTADATRLAAVNFSASYTTSVQSVIIVNNKTDSAAPADPADKKTGIAVPADLAGKKIGVLQGTPAQVYCTEEFGQAAVTGYGTDADAGQALLQRQVDALVMDSVSAKTLAQTSEEFKLLDDDYKKDEFAIAVNKDSVTLLKKINSALAELKASGEIRAIIKKYYG